MDDRDAWRVADGPDQAALLEAVEEGKDDVVRDMLGRGVRPDVPVTPSGMRPAHHAVMAGHVKVLDALCDAGANVNEPGEIAGSVLQYAVQEFDWDANLSLALTTALLFPPEGSPANRSRTTHRDVLGPALSFACAHGYVPIITLLLRAGADPNYFPDGDDYATTPLVQLIYENEQKPTHAQVACMLVSRHPHCHQHDINS